MKYPNLADVLDTAAPGIDHSKILSYGCQCQFLDGRPLAASGNGHPVDPIDSACKQYRECQTCAQMDDGASCNVESVDWMYRIDLDVPQLDCLDPGSISSLLLIILICFLSQKLCPSPVRMWSSVCVGGGGRVQILRWSLQSSTFWPKVRITGLYVV